MTLSKKVRRTEAPQYPPSDLFQLARDVVQQAHPERIFHLVQQAAPGGERKGDEYIPRNPMRADQEPGSLFINIKKKCWNDFADGSSGDLIALIAGIHGIKRNEAAQYLIEKLNTDRDEKEEAIMSAAPLSNQDKRQDDVEMISLPKYPDDFPLAKGESYRGGTITAIYPYRDGKDTVSFYTFRCDKPGQKKEFGWLFWGKHKGKEEAEWIFKAPPKPRILFGLYRALEERKTAPVLVVEGEKAAMAAHKKAEWQDYAPIASAGGANAATSTDWTALKDRDVVIAPDHDEPGRNYAKTVCHLLEEAGARSIHVIQWPEHFPKGWDIADDLPEIPQNEMTNEKENNK